MTKVIADAHCDSIQYALDNNLTLDNRRLSFNFEDVSENSLHLQLMACFVHDKYKDNGYDRISKILEYYLNQEKNAKNILRITDKDDIDRFKEKNNIGIMLTAENGVCIDKDIAKLYSIYDNGIRMMTITWNNDNELGCGNLTLNDIGLSSFGVKCIKEMNKINMIVDVSHSSPKTFYNILSITTKPVIASHSNVYNLCRHTRNLTDNQIKDISRIGGLIGINYCNKFLTENKETSISDVVNHIKYICDLVGTEHVCLGSDFDGIEKTNLPHNLKGIKDIPKLEECLLYNGFNTEEIAKIMGENLITFIKNNIS